MAPQTAQAALPHKMHHHVSESLSHPVYTVDEARAMVASLKTSQRLRRRFDFRRQFVITAGAYGTDEVPLPTEGAFESEGYNIEYTTQADGTAPVYIRMKSQSDGQGQSNDYLPIRSISTPGAVVAGSPGIRYGMRPFWHFYEKSDKLTIEFDGTQMTAGQTITVNIVFTGWLYTGL